MGQALSKTGVSLGQSPETIKVDVDWEDFSMTPEEIRKILGLRNRIQAHYYKLPHIGGTSKYKGVCWHKWSKSWNVQIKFNGKRYTKYLRNEKEAARTYDKMALALFGEYAYTNQMAFPEDFKE
jgi:hypothetical protein